MSTDPKPKGHLYMAAIAKLKCKEHGDLPAISFCPTKGPLCGECAKAIAPGEEIFCIDRSMHGRTGVVPLMKRALSAHAGMRIAHTAHATKASRRKRAAALAFRTLKKRIKASVEAFRKRGNAALKLAKGRFKRICREIQETHERAFSAPDPADALFQLIVAPGSNANISMASIEMSIDDVGRVEQQIRDDTAFMSLPITHYSVDKPLSKLMDRLESLEQDLLPFANEQSASSPAIDLKADWVRTEGRVSLQRFCFKSNITQYAGFVTSTRISYADDRMAVIWVPRMLLKGQHPAPDGGAFVFDSKHLKMYVRGVATCSPYLPELRDHPAYQLEDNLRFDCIYETRWSVRASGGVSLGKLPPGTRVVSYIQSDRQNCQYRLLQDKYSREYSMMIDNAHVQLPQPPGAVDRADDVAMCKWGLRECHDHSIWRDVNECHLIMLPEGMLMAFGGSVYREKTVFVPVVGRELIPKPRVFIDGSRAVEDTRDDWDLDCLNSFMDSWPQQMCVSNDTLVVLTDGTLTAYEVTQTPEGITISPSEASAQLQSLVGGCIGGERIMQIKLIDNKRFVAITKSYVVNIGIAAGRETE